MAPNNLRWLCFSKSGGIGVDLLGPIVSILLQSLNLIIFIIMEPGKEFTKADDKGPRDIVVYEKQGVFVYPVYSEVADRKFKIFGKAANLLQSRNGELIVAASEKQVLIYSLKEQRPVAEKQFNYIHSITFSPNETYLQVLDKINVNEGKTMLLSLPALEQVAVFKEDQSTGYFNKQHFPLVRFASDDIHYFRYNNKIVEVYRNNAKVDEIQSGFIEFFEVSKVSRDNSYLIVTIFLDKKTNEGRCEIFTQKSSKQAIYTKNIKKAEQIKVRFSPTSNQFLMELQTYFDPSGKSYYGEFGLFIYNDTKNKISSVKTENGPVHDFSWHRSGQKFIVISGFMPASIKMFNRQNQIIFQFGKKHRNSINWGHLGRFVCLAGFGNLNGEMQIWDLEQLKQIGYCKSNSASYCAWSLDDRKILTAIITPRLRVDNCIKVYSYTGTILNKVGYEQTELYGAYWIKIPYEGKARGISPGRKIQIEPKKEEGKFKSFGSAMNYGSMTFQQKVEQKQKPKLVPGQFPDEEVQKKKRKRKNNKEVEVLEPKE